MQRMTTKERLLGAIRCQDVDYVPMSMHFWHNPRHARARWSNERERLARLREWEWDTTVTITPEVTPSREVQVEASYETDGGTTVLRQVWHTPAGDLEERLRVTADWESAKAVTEYLPLLDDWRTPRYIEFPVKTREDVEKLAYLFPVESAEDTERMVRGHRHARELADEFEVPLMVEHVAGMDWLTWLYSAEEAVLRVMDDRPAMKRVLEIINRAYERRLELLLELGVEAVERRGWYETTDYWSPEIVADLARPAVEAEIEKSHLAGAAYVYLMATGVMPLLPMLSAMQFDCLHGAEVAYGGQESRAIRRGLAGKSIWGGISGPEHLGRGTPESVERAVEQAFEDCGRRGFILGMAVGIRENWPEENLAACERAWRRLRAGTG